MTKTDFKNVDEYIAVQPEAGQAVLGTVRSAIRKALPKAEEVISYKMPAYKLHGRVVLYFAGWKQHYSLYPAGDRLVAAFKDELTPYKISKAKPQPIPVWLVRGCADCRTGVSASPRSGNGRACEFSFRDEGIEACRARVA
jgi:uncharacterized protein YdhG (YjbR/CyaY superfamily)